MRRASGSSRISETQSAVRRRNAVRNIGHDRLELGIHALESYILTPIIQREALEIPPATLFAFQILLGVVFGIWGLALALPLIAIVKVMIVHFKADDTAVDAVAAA